MAERRKYSRPMIKKMITVNTEEAIRAMEQYVNRTMSQLYLLDVVLFHIADKEFAEEQNSKVEEILAGKLKELDKNIAKLQAFVDDNDIEELSGFSEQQSHEYKIYSPLCSRYLKLFTKFDVYMTLIDRIWMDGEMPSGERGTKQIKMSRHFKNVSNEIKNLGLNALSKARESGQEKEVFDSVKDIAENAENDDIKMELAKELNNSEKQKVA
jgi:cell division FtsZ-interacting protein ZapD